jgi:hypothetical protein
LVAVCKPLVLLLNFFMPPKNAQAKPESAPKKSRKLCFRRFTASPIARSKSSPRTPACRRTTRTPAYRLTVRCLLINGFATSFYRT